MNLEVLKSWEGEGMNRNLDVAISILIFNFFCRSDLGCLSLALEMILVSSGAPYSEVKPLLEGLLPRSNEKLT